MSNFNTVLFDLGSTLIYFDSDWETILEEAVHTLHHKLLAMGFQLDDHFPQKYRSTSREIYRWRDEELVETPADEVLRRVLKECGQLEIGDQQVSEALAALYAVSQAHWHGEIDAIPTLRTLRDQGYQIGLISNAGYDNDVQVLIDRAGLRPYLDFIISSAACRIRKPDPRIFHLALDHFKVAPAQAVMVGDFLAADVVGANKVGMGSVWITRRADLAASQPLLSTIRPNQIIASLSELPAVLTGWE
jgi:HAD superfamily hydrolase (TIGR01662 family)